MGAGAEAPNAERDSPPPPLAPPAGLHRLAASVQMESAMELVVGATGSLGSKIVREPRRRRRRDSVGV